MRYGIRIAEYNLDCPSMPVRITFVRRTFYDDDGRRLASPVAGFSWPKAARIVQMLRDAHETRYPQSFALHIQPVPV
jgi:hypothetical protein